MSVYGRIWALDKSRAWPGSHVSPPLTPRTADSGITWRPLHVGDYDRGYLRLLGQLTKAPEVSVEQWTSTFEKMRKR